MIQVYFLLVLTNVLGGFILAKQGLKKPFIDHWEKFFNFFEKPYSRLCLGLLAFISGFLGLIFVLPGEQIFLGDLIPSLTSMFAGTALVLSFYEKDSSSVESPLQRLDDILLKNRVVIGFLSIVFGILHFIAPMVIFL